MNDVIEHALRDVEDSDVVGMTIQNQVNQNDKPIGISFRRKDQLSAEVIWSVFEKVSQSISTFNALDTLVVTVHSVKMPVGFGKHAIKSRGRPLSVMAHLKRNIVEVQAEENCLAHALIIAIARLEKDPNYNSYRRGYKICHVVQKLCKTAGIDLSNGGGIPKLVRLQEHFRENKIVVYHGLRCEDVKFEGQVDSIKRLNLLYDNVERHYHVIAKLTATTARKYVCKRCNKACKSDVTQSEARRVATAWPALRSHSHLSESPVLNAIDILEATNITTTTNKALNRNVPCATSEWVVTREKEECNTRSFDNSKNNKDVNHLWYMRPLKDALPSAGVKVL